MVENGSGVKQAIWAPASGRSIPADYYGFLTVYECSRGHVFGSANDLGQIPCSHCERLATALNSSNGGTIVL